MITEVFDPQRGPFAPPPAGGTFAGVAQPSYNPNVMSPTEVHADFPAEPTSAGLARRFVDATLREWSCDPLLEVATLLVSELVANAVLHAGTQIRVGIRMNRDRLRIEVQDGNARRPARKHYSSLSTTGRGLLLVERMADQWGVAPAGNGKIVWFELDATVSADVPTYAGFAFGEIELDDLDDLRGERGGRDDGGERGGRDRNDGPRALVPLGRR
jgi:anti-sigma regulatory factor (Ser/Thr protein kinase)